MNRFATILVSAMLFGSIHCAAQEAVPVNDVPPALIGTWRLVEWSATTASGDKEHPFGPKAVGRIAYGTDGSMSFHLMDPSVPPFKSPVRALASADEIEAGWKAYFAYFGTYSVDSNKGIVTHHIEGCSFPNWNGTEQKRNYQFDGTSLVLEGQTADQKSHRLVWKKAK